MSETENVTSDVTIPLEEDNLLRVSAEELNTILQFNGTINDKILSIGKLELTKGALTLEIQELEEYKKGFLERVAEKYQIPRGCVWNIDLKSRVITISKRQQDVGPKARE